MAATGSQVAVNGVDPEICVFVIQLAALLFGRKNYMVTFAKNELTLNKLYMNCYKHPIQSAVATCPDCGKGLCVECASSYMIPICNVCNKRRINEEKTRIIKEMVLTFSLGILLAVLLVRAMNSGYTVPLTHTILLVVVFSYPFSGIVPGWKTLSRITPDVFLLMPIIGWVFYLIIKLVLSLCLGLVMLPIRTVRNIHRLTTLQKINV